MNPRISKNRLLTGSHIMAMSLLAEGVTDIFGYPRGAIIPFYDALTDFPELRHILVRNEQGAALAAIGYSRATGHMKIGVCVSTSGPGATNLVTGIYDAYMDSMPIIAITGQVPLAVVGTDAFQEADVIGITQPITKQSYFVTDANDIPRIVKEAFHIARTGRPGPVLIDFPKDIQNQIVDKFEYPETVDLKGYKPVEVGNIQSIKEAAAMLTNAKKPLILAGHGVLIANAMAELNELITRTDIPIVTTIHGKGCFPEHHPACLGMIGMHGFAYANFAVQDCDVLFAIGLRFDDRIIGRADDFAPKAKIIHVDIDPAEHGKNIKPDLPIVGDARKVLQELNRWVGKPECEEWLGKLGEWRGMEQDRKDRKENESKSMVKGQGSNVNCGLPNSELPTARSGPEPSGPKANCQLSMRSVIREINRQTNGECIVASDVGQHQMIAAQEFVFKHPHLNLTSGGSGTMGYSLPAAMGAKVACPDKEVWCVVGDGSIQMNMQELVTLSQDQIPIKIAVMNNSYLGMVRQWQELFYENNYSQVKLHNPDFVKLAEACGLTAFKAVTQEEMPVIIKRMRSEKGPVLCEFVVKMEENVYPMVPTGKSLSETITE